MKSFLYLAVEYVARIHDRILMLNDNYAASLNDKQLHFLVIGLLGMLLFFLIHPIFKALARHGHEIVISWFYVFTLMVVITFAIEIGQRLSNTGSMEFSDIVYGMGGFLWMFAVFALLRGLILLICRLVGRRKKQKQMKEQTVRGKHESKGTQ